MSRESIVTLKEASFVKSQHDFIDFSYKTIQDSNLFNTGQGFILWECLFSICTQKKIYRIVVFYYKSTIIWTTLSVYTEIPAPQIPFSQLVLRVFFWYDKEIQYICAWYGENDVRWNVAQKTLLKSHQLKKRNIFILLLGLRPDTLVQHLPSVQSVDAVH